MAHIGLCHILDCDCPGMLLYKNIIAPLTSDILKQVGGVNTGTYYGPYKVMKQALGHWLLAEILKSSLR